MSNEKGGRHPFGTYSQLPLSLKSFWVNGRINISIESSLARVWPDCVSEAEKLKGQKRRSGRKGEAPQGEKRPHYGHQGPRHGLKREFLRRFVRNGDLAKERRGKGAKRPSHVNRPPRRRSLMPRCQGAPTPRLALSTLCKVTRDRSGTLLPLRVRARATRPGCDAEGGENAEKRVPYFRPGAT
jgi:hypothetical protein